MERQLKTGNSDKSGLHSDVINRNNLFVKLSKDQMPHNCAALSPMRLMHTARVPPQTTVSLR